MMSRKLWLFNIALLASILFFETAFAKEPYSHMHMLLQKTIFDIDVLDVEVEVDQLSQAQLRKLWKHQTYSEKLADQTAQILYNSQHVSIDK